MRMIAILAALAAMVLAAASAGTAGAAERVYYIAAEEVRWDYAPAGRDVMMGKPFDDEQKVFVGRSPTAIGSTYIKALYREYTDASFTTKKPRSAAWRHLGFLGPVIHAEVGDTIKVFFRNKTDRAYSIHPHGVFYNKASEGAPYDDGTLREFKADDAVPPGATHRYLWRVPERAGPGPADPSSIGWLYHSHTNSVADTNAGLVGVIIVTAKGKARPDGTPKDVDREFVILMTISDENASGYLERNIAAFADPAKVDRASEDFAEGNLMHGINGYVYGNLPGLVMRQNQRTRWYMFALGTEVDLHTPHWHGATGLMRGRRIDVFNLLPASGDVVDIVPDNPGTWMFHCHVNDHISAGMTALWRVTP